MRIFFAALSGLLFGIGLTLAQMTDPAKVLGFLDLFSGLWDPSLAFVMAGGLITFGVGFFFIKKRAAPTNSPVFHFPTATQIDRPLILGAVLFGIGWGLVGLCPGPAFAGLLLGGWSTALFLGATLVGMIGFELYNRSKA